MNRTDRMLAIVLELQVHGVRRGADLAATFEVSKRTIYRDIEALCEAGVPVVAEPGRGYSLVEGYFLPPLRFSAAEAAMLLLGSDVMAQHFDAEYQQAALAAGRKITAVLPAHERDEVDVLRASFRFIASDVPEETALLPVIRRALGKQRSISFCYQGRHNTAPALAQRTADPYGLARVTGAWYMVAYCHDRNDIRHFRLARMSDVVLLDQTFERPAHTVFAARADDGRDITVQALFDARVARWVREARMFYVVAEEERPDGLLVTLRVRREDDALPWLLGWGGAVRVLTPDSLRQRMAAAATAILTQYNA